jgi:hypothetical protein
MPVKLKLLQLPKMRHIALQGVLIVVQDVMTCQLCTVKSRMRRLTCREEQDLCRVINSRNAVKEDYFRLGDLILYYLATILLALVHQQYLMQAAGSGQI